MSRTFSVPRLNDTTTNPSSTSRRSSMYIEPRVPRNPWMIRTGGTSGVRSSNAAPRRIRLPRTRWRRYDSPSAPPTTSWPIVLRLPSQRRGASSAQRLSHVLRRSAATSRTIVRESLGDEAAALLRIGMTGRRLGRVFDHSPLAAGADLADPADEVCLDAIYQYKLMTIRTSPQGPRISRRYMSRWRGRIFGVTGRDLARSGHPRRIFCRSDLDCGPDRRLRNLRGGAARRR